ncbi:hypothetical protein ACRRTK_012275 [Alexandromys fortis]
MEAEFYMAILTCLILGSLEGFQIVHVRKQQCLSINQNVVMSSCNASSQNQQWLSTEDGKLLHIKSGSCLGISNSSRGPFRPAVSTPCAQAPRWTCHDQEGFLEVENTSLFLKKQNRKVVVKKISKYLDSWMKLDTNKEGKLVSENLCAKQAGLGTEVSVRIARNSVAPQILTTFHTVPYSPEHTRNTTETFLGSTAETYRPSSSKRALPSLHTTGTTVTAWSPSTTPPSFGITTEVKGVPDGAWGRGSAGQNGSVGRAARCGSPPPVASAARPGRQQKQLLPRP